MDLRMEKMWLGELAGRSRAVALVRGLLGCACPEEIFDHFQVRHQGITDLTVVELIMGERLLVWIIAGDRMTDPGQFLERLLNGGFKEKQRRGLNRFRLVVVGDFPSWEKRWSHLADTLDPKVHLHVLPDILPPGDYRI